MHSVWRALAALTTRTTVAALAVTVSGCVSSETTDPGLTPADEELPVIWREVIAPPGSFQGYACGVTTTATAYCWGTTPGVGQSRRPVVVPGAYSFARITGGTFHACGLTTTGAAVCWGQFLGLDPTPFPPLLADTLAFSALSAGNPFTCGLVEQRLFCRTHLTTPFRPHAALHRFQAVSSGVAAVCALDLEGVVWCWNTIDSSLRLGAEQVVRGPAPFRALSVGRQRCAITVDDATYCWGAPGDINLPVGGRVSVPIAGGHRFRSISVGDYYACGVTMTDAAWCWGSNDNGQFGTGEIRPTTTDIPVPVSGALRFASIAAGAATTCGVTLDGAAYCWGDANSGQVGDASPQQPLSAFERRLVPTRVANPLR